MSTNKANTNNGNKTAKPKANKPKVKRNSQRQAVKPTPPGEYVLLHEVIMEEDQFVGYKFQRAARVKLPNGKSHLLPLEEYINIDVSHSMDILPYVLRILDSENKKCMEFVSTQLPVPQHSAESKLKKYLANRPEEISVVLSDQLNGSIIETKEAKASEES